MLTPSGRGVVSVPLVPPPPTDRHPCCACVEHPNPTFGKEICHRSNMNMLHKVQEAAASAVGDKHQTGEG